VCWENLREIRKWDQNGNSLPEGRPFRDTTAEWVLGTRPEMEIKM
jgi:hypothetical protein